MGLWGEIDSLLNRRGIRKCDSSRNGEKIWKCGVERFGIAVRGKSIVVVSLKRYGGLLVKNYRAVRTIDDIIGIYMVEREFPWLMKLKII